MDNIASSRNLEGKDCQPTDGVFPTASKAERGVDEATNVHSEGSIDRIDDRQLCESLHHAVARLLCQPRPSSFGIEEAYTMNPKNALATTSLCRNSRRAELTNDDETKKHRSRSTSCESTT